MKHISEIFWADFPEKIVYDSDNLYDPYLVIFQGIAYTFQNCFIKKFCYMSIKLKNKKNYEL